MLKLLLVNTFCILSFSLNAYQSPKACKYKDNLTYFHSDTDNSLSVEIINSTNEFYFDKPHFILSSNSQANKIWWQISSSQNFSKTISTFESICAFNNVITLSDLEETFLENDTTYYFRARCGDDHLWSPWSSPFTFTVIKTEPVADLHCSNDLLQKKVHSNNAPSSTQYVRNPYVSEEIWNSLSPYFFPEHFPEKAVLDRIFSKRRVLSSVNSMYKSGFNLITRSKRKIIVGRHPNLKGYIIKAFVDESSAPDWICLAKRIEGVNAIRELIIKNGYEGIMKAPKKWIYPLPPEPSPLKNFPNRKNFILIAEEMDLLGNKQNLKAYKTKITPQILDAFYVMLTELQLIDSVYADNTGFCKDGRLAFVDTEHSLNTLMPVPLPTVAQYLSREMVLHWQQLYFNGGPQR